MNHAHQPKFIFLISATLRIMGAMVRLVLVGFMLTFCLLHIALFYGRADVATRQKMVSSWADRLLYLLGMKVDFQSAVEPVRLYSGLMVCNHISFIDIFVINSVLPSPFVAKNNIASWPFIGWLVARTGTEFIQRGSKTAAHQTQQRITARLAAGERFAIFPEGTTSSGAQVLPFHAALFQSAVDSAASLHCLCLSYHDASGAVSDAPAFLGDMTLLRCMFNIAAAGGLTARLRVLPSEDHPEQNRRQLAHRAQHRIGAAVAVLNSSSPTL
jgi:1-acyl-sn-glycerol-3-phosphate acyltransferase